MPIINLEHQEVHGGDVEAARLAAPAVGRGAERIPTAGQDAVGGLSLDEQLAQAVIPSALLPKVTL